MAEYTDKHIIYVERLRQGGEEELNFTLDSSVIAVDEPELAYRAPVSVNGRTYLAEDELILQLDLQTEALMQCKICNEQCTVEIKPETLYHIQAVNEISAGTLDVVPVIREHLILETPHYAECNGGACPEREAVAKYIVAEGASNGLGSQSNPFETL